MQAALFRGPHRLDINELDIPELSKDDLLVKVGACGICGTDFHIFNGEAPAVIPVVIGHEYTGEVIETGKAVEIFKPGDRVAINPNIHCGYCQFCREGKINLCINLKALGVTINGGFAQYSVVPQGQAFLLPGDFPFEKAAFAEPLSCCIHGIDQADIKLRDVVVIIGAGTIGLLMLQLTLLWGAKRVIVLEPSEYKRELALNSGADNVIDPFSSSFKEIFDDICPMGADVVIECVGTADAAAATLQIIKRGGRIVIFGLAGPGAFLQLPLQQFFHKELTVKTSLLNPNTFQSSVDLLINKKINVDIINPLYVPFKSKELNHLFSGAKNSSVIKYMIKPNN